MMVEDAGCGVRGRGRGRGRVGIGVDLSEQRHRSGANTIITGGGGRVVATGINYPS